jgi:ribosome biogenesis protein BRX1
VECLTGECLRSFFLLVAVTELEFSHRHLLADLNSLLPHTYKDTKLDTKSSNHYNAALNGLADLHSCSYIFFLEARKHGQDLYLWLAKAPNGPTIKFSVSNVHTMGELGFGGNCLKGGRGIVVFDKSFDATEFGGGQEHKGLVRELLRGVFCVPGKGVRGMKPFVDRITGIFGLDGKIWIRIYEIRESDKKAEDGDGSINDVSLVEIGPRFVLTPIVILEGSFGGPVIFENREFVSPNQVRSEVRMKKASRHARRTDERNGNVIKRGALGLDRQGKRPKNPLDSDVLFR